ncbi:MAG: InlB B-repeat-containing protein, partial [Salinivirgaceae bacterium]|nr:InlB B-repeat-containing protein [Salinivirgaceae bacterium]
VDGDNTKAAKSKFAVAGRTASKGEEDLLTIDAEGATVFVDDNYNDDDNTNADDNAKAAKSKFAVAGRSAKGDNNIITIDGSGSTIYVGGEGKAAKSKFAVAGRSAKKAAKNNYSLDGDGSTVYVDFDDNASKGNADVLSIDGGQATFYVDDTDEGKAAKSKFAVAGRSANKDVQTAFIIDGSGTLIYIDDLEGDKAAKSKFAVAGRSTSKGNDNFFTIDRDSTRIYINDEPVAADTTGIGSGITPTTPSFASAFAIVGMTKKNDLLVVNKDSAIVKTNTYIAEDIQSSTGEVEKLPDDTKADKVYTTGEFLLELQGKYGSDYDEVNYTYYRNGADEYLYLCEHFNDEHYEYRNYWLVDGKIYRDTTYLKSWNGLVPIYTYRNDFGEYFNGCRWKDYWGTEPFVAEGGSNGGLLTILESKIRQDGYKVRAEEGVNLYYKIVENEEWPAAETERNTVTALYDVDIFNSQNYLTTFKMLLEPSVAIMGKDFGIEDIAYIEWNANYTFLDSCVTSQNIVDMEYELGSYTVYDDEGNPVYDEDNPMKLETEAEVFQCKDEHRKYTLDEIDYMFYALKKGFVVMVSPTEGGTVTGIDGGNGTYNYGDKITLKAEPNDGYIFLGWNDGSIENPRTIAVMGHTTVWANFQSQSDYELVDLGLTTKWAKSNLGALSSTSAGGYYAWGETGTKSAYTQSTYTLESSSDFRDAATTILGNNYRMPAIEDWIALKDSCNWEYDSDKGCFKVSSKKNSNYIYIPATGYFDDYDGYQDFVPDDSYSNCYYLSRSEDSYYYFKTFLICSDAGDSQVTERYKYYGYQIRPVANTYNVTLVADGNGTVSGGGIFNAGATTTITATPGDGYCFVRWSDGNSDNPRLLAVTEHTNLEAVFADIIYVSQANPDLETHNGSEEFPYSSIAEAVSAMESDKNYEIRVVGTIEGPQVISDCPAKVLSLTGYGDNAKLDGKGSAANPATTLSIAANTVIIKNLTITGGYAAGSNNAAGIDVSGNVTIDQGVVVTGNTAVNGASIVYVDGSELHIQGGRIVGNTAENAHKGVYLHGWGQNVRATLCLSGNPVVEDIYPSYIDNWPDYHQVTLEGNLSGDASINITPYDYYVGLNLVISYVSMADNREYFTITPNSEGHDWTITDEGTLSYNCTLTFNVNGNVVETRKVLYGEKTEAPDMPQNPYTNEYVFAGWYYENTNEGNMFVAFDFENESVGQDNMQLQPKWLKPSKQLVVNTSLSNNIDADGTAEKPFNHIQNAIAAIELFDNPDWEYTITVTGMDSKSVNIGSDYGDTFPAKSVLLKGSGSGNNGIGLSGDNINPVCIYTSAQVKFEDFKLEFNGSVTDYVEAMALIVGREADVTLINTEIAGCDNQQ